MSWYSHRAVGQISWSASLPVCQFASLSSVNQPSTQASKSMHGPPPGLCVAAWVSMDGWTNAHHILEACKLAGVRGECVSTSINHGAITAHCIFTAAEIGSGCACLAFSGDSMATNPRTRQDKTRQTRQTRHGKIRELGTNTMRCDAMRCDASMRYEVFVCEYGVLLRKYEVCLQQDASQSPLAPCHGQPSRPSPPPHAPPS